MTIKCSRCKITELPSISDRDALEDWLVLVDLDSEDRIDVVGPVCPGCVTPELQAEAAIRSATQRVDFDPDGRVTLRPKITD